MIMIGVLPVCRVAGRKIWARSGCGFGLDRTQPPAQIESAITATVAIRLDFDPFILQWLAAQTVTLGLFYRLAVRGTG